MNQDSLSWNESDGSRLRLMWRYRTLHRAMIQTLKTLGVYCFLLVAMSWAFARYNGQLAKPLPVMIALASMLAALASVVPMLHYLGKVSIDKETRKIMIGDSSFDARYLNGYRIEVEVAGSLLLLDTAGLGLFPIRIPPGIDLDQVREAMASIGVEGPIR